MTINHNPDLLFITSFILFFVFKILLFIQCCVQSLVHSKVSPLYFIVVNISHLELLLNWLILYALFWDLLSSLLFFFFCEFFISLVLGLDKKFLIPFLEPFRSGVCVCVSCLKTLLHSGFRLAAKGKVQGARVPLPPPRTRGLPHCCRPLLVRLLKLTSLMHHNHPKSQVCLRLHSWCCTFYSFRQMYPSI